MVSNADLVKEAKVIPFSISDSELIFVVLKVKKSRPKPTYILTRSYENYKPEAFVHDLSQAPWNIIGMFEVMDDYLYALDRHAPVKKVKIRSRPT